MGKGIVILVLAALFLFLHVWQLEIKIPETEFDNLFVLTPKADGSPIVMRLRY
jgi:hypothetical protein